MRVAGRRRTSITRNVGVGMAAVADKTKALDAAMAQIDKQFGKGSVMRLGDESRAPDRGHPDRARSRWTSPSASAACRAAGSWRSTARSPPVRRPSPCTRWPTPRGRRHRGLHRRRARARPRVRRQARRRHRRAAGLPARHRRAGAGDRRHADPLRRARHHRHRLGRRPGAPRRDRRRDGRQPRRPAGPPDEPGPAQDHRPTQQHQAPPPSSSTSCARRSASCSAPPRPPPVARR